MSIFDDRFQKAREARGKTVPDVSQIIQRPQQSVTAPVARLVNGVIPAEGFDITPTGLVMKPNATVDNWVDVGQMLFSIEGRIEMTIGDFLNLGESHFNYPIEAVADELGRDVSSLRKYAWIAGKVKTRYDGLFYSHYELVAAMPEKDQEKWLLAAISNKWTVKELKEEIGKSKTKKVRAKKPVTEQFSDSVVKTWNRYAKQIKKRPTEERTFVADRLRALADEIDST